MIFQRNSVRCAGSASTGEKSGDGAGSRWCIVLNGAGVRKGALSALYVMGFFSALVQAGCAPLINDIVTDPDNPPRIEVDGSVVPYDRAQYKKQSEHYPLVIALKVHLPADKVFAEAQQLAKVQSGWSIVQTDEDNIRFQVLVRTRLLRFKDDLVVEVRSDENSQSVVHMRSRSRLGRSDFGANSNRIIEFLDALKEQLFEEHLLGGAE